MTVLFIAAMTLVAVDVIWGVGRTTRTDAAATGQPRPTASAPAPTASAAPVIAAPSATPSGTPTYTGPVFGTNQFSYATTQTAVFGTGGTLHRFRVAVEGGLNQDANMFAAAAVKILSDSRSWIAGGDVRLQQVPNGAPYDFTLYLASPGTSEKMCLVAGLQTDKYTSCRITGKVIINLARYLSAVPNYGAALDIYQEYAINHEVGHELGHGHEACPGAGRLAPVMLQQTLSLRGCTPNPWPFVAGRRYAGSPIP